MTGRAHVKITHVYSDGEQCPLGFITRQAFRATPQWLSEDLSNMDAIAARILGSEQVFVVNLHGMSVDENSCGWAFYIVTDAPALAVGDVLSLESLHEAVARGDYYFV
jgi:hypothetical protein